MVAEPDAGVKALCHDVGERLVDGQVEYDARVPCLEAMKIGGHDDLPCTKGERHPQSSGTGARRIAASILGLLKAIRGTFVPRSAKETGSEKR